MTAVSPNNYKPKGRRVCDVRVNSGAINLKLEQANFGLTPDNDDVSANMFDFCVQFIITENRSLQAEKH